jgi:uncharacterized protein YgiM (DUF1202 family)
MSKSYDYTKANKEAVKDILEESVEVEDKITAAEEVIRAEEPIEAYGKHAGKIVGCMNLNVRVEPNIESKVARIVSKNDTVTIVGESGDWYEIVTMGGDHGYSMKQYIER